jgi:predicted  nucleic acid-binding Zn-ribbon protein
LSTEAERALKKLLDITTRLQYTRDMQPEATDRIKDLINQQRDALRTLESTVAHDVAGAYSAGKSDEQYAQKIIERGLIG